MSLDVFGVFLCQIIDQIYAFPGITETRILKQFDYVCPRTSLLDFLARLELTGIIIKQRVKYQEPRLVSDFFPFFVKKFRNWGSDFLGKNFETYWSPIPFSSNDSRDVDLICYQCSNVAIESVTSLFHQIQKESGLCQPEGSGSQMNWSHSRIIRSVQMSHSRKFKNSQLRKILFQIKWTEFQQVRFIRRTAR